jgi:hypothetical protein
MSIETNSVISGDLMDCKTMYQQLPNIERDGLQYFQKLDRESLEKLIRIKFQLHSLAPPELMPMLDTMGSRSQSARRQFVQSHLRGSRWKKYAELRAEESSLSEQLTNARAEEWLDQLNAADFGGNENDDHAR